MKRKLIIPILIILPLCLDYIRIYSCLHTTQDITSIENDDWDKFNKWIVIECFINMPINNKSTMDNNIIDGIGQLMTSNLKETFIDNYLMKNQKIKMGVLKNTK